MDREKWRSNFRYIKIRRIDNNTAFSFVWMVEDEPVFRGVGMEIGLNKIAVSYWDSNSITFTVQ